MFNTIEEAIKAIKDGEIVIVIDDENRENEGDFVCSAQLITPEQVNFIAKYGKGLICTPLTEDIAKKLDLDLMTTHNTDNHQTAFTISVDHVDTSTGISAFDRMITINGLANPKAVAKDFRRPGHIFPLIARKNGLFEREGHTEATVELMKLAGLAPVGVCCEIMDDDGTMMKLDHLLELAKKYNLKIINIAELKQYVLKHLKVKLEASAKLPTEFGEFKINVYKNPINDRDEVAIIKEPLDFSKPILVRLHSECLTGDVMHSLKCDCGPQLQCALHMINEAHSGVLLYLRQEGRDIGLVNKIKAYALQDQGYDTIEANQLLGFDADLRHYDVAAAILRDLHVHDVDLITNNPDKVKQLINDGINVVKTTPLKPSINDYNRGYLKIKRDQMGHNFGEEIENETSGRTFSTCKK